MIKKKKKKHGSRKIKEIGQYHVITESLIFPAKRALCDHYPKKRQKHLLHIKPSFAEKQERTKPASQSSESREAAPPLASITSTGSTPGELQRLMYVCHLEFGTKPSLGHSQDGSLSPLLGLLSLHEPSFRSCVSVLRSTI